MNTIKEIKNLNFHNQIGGEKIKEITMILLLSFNDKIIYDSVFFKNCKQLQERMEEINTNDITGVSYIAVTDKMNFIEYKRIITNK